MEKAPSKATGVIAALITLGIGLVGPVRTMMATEEFSDFGLWVSIAMVSLTGLVGLYRAVRDNRKLVNPADDPWNRADRASSQAEELERPVR